MLACELSPRFTTVAKQIGASHQSSVNIGLSHDSSLNIPTDYDVIDEQPNEKPVQRVLATADWHEIEHWLSVTYVDDLCRTLWNVAGLAISTGVNRVHRGV